VYSVEHFQYTARRRWHIEVAQFNTTVESVDDSVDDRRRRAEQRPRSPASVRCPDQPRYVVFQMAEVAIPRQMFQEILRLIAELRPQPPPAPA
jgi:hypothetical protein